MGSSKCHSNMDKCRGLKGDVNMQKINRIRLIADEGKILVNGNKKGYVVDINIEDVDLWIELNDDKESEG